MQHRRWLVGLGLAVTTLAPLKVRAQQSPSGPASTGARLSLTSASEPAKVAFREALLESHNVAPDRARARIAAAVSADPSFGLAKIYQVVIAVGLSAADRERAIGEAMSTMGTATTQEFLLAALWREGAAGRAAAALPLVQVLSQLVPGDEQVAYLQLNSQNAGKPPAEQEKNIRAYLRAHPQYAAAQNTLTYLLWNMGDRDGALGAVREYVRLAPMHPNAHDSYADILILMGKAEEALAHTQREIEVDPAFLGSQVKLGAIHLMMNDLPAARAAFAAGLAAATLPAQRYEPMTWTAITSVYAGDGKGALRDLGQVAEAARSANAPNQAALAHLRMAVVEAYLGSKTSVAAHVEAAGALQAPNPNHFLHRALAFSRIGEAQRARDAAAQFSAAAATAPILPALNATLALDANDLTTAEAALAQTSASDVLTQALRAELMIRKGQRGEGEVLRKEALARSVKVANNNTLDFSAVVARMRLRKL